MVGLRGVGDPVRQRQAPRFRHALEQLLRARFVEGHAGGADGLQTIRIVVHAEDGQPAIGERQCERQSNPAQADDGDVEGHESRG